MPALLFICTANQCRSPVAAALARRLASQSAPDTPWRIESAGTWAQAGRPLHPEMARAAQAAGLVLPAHRARSIEHVPALHEFDLILTMARHQQEALQVEFPHLRLRIQLLSALAGPPYDIPDPIGGPPGAYQQTVAELHRLLMDAWPHLCKLLAN